MLKVGLTGGLASGKSFVGQALADLGFAYETPILTDKGVFPDTGVPLKAAATVAFVVM